jgi:parallel beta-helix repeat protein
LVWFLSFDDNNAADGYVYKSINGGQNFTSMVVGSNWATKYHLSLKASDADKDICFAGNMYLHRTTNGGTNWDCVGGYCGMHADVKGFDINPFSPNKITEGNDGGVFRSDDLGGNWISCNQNLGSLSLLWGLASSTYDASFVAGGLHDFSSFSYNSNAGPGSTYWNAAIGGGGDCGNMIASPFKSKYFVSNILTGNQNIYYSSDGTNFGYATGYAESSTYSVEVGPFTYHPSLPGAVYTARFDKWSNTQTVQFRKSTDYGATWGGDEYPLRELQRPSTLDNTAPCFIAISQSNPNTMIMDFSNGNEFWFSTFDARSGLIKSTNGGLNWFNEHLYEPITPIVEGGSGGTPNRCFTDVEFDPKDENVLYLTLSGYYYPSTNEGHVFTSTDGGYNWSSISGNLPDIPVNDIMIHYTGTGSNDKELIVATDAGIYASNAVNIYWQEKATDFPNSPAFHLDYNRLSGKLRANTWGRGAWELDIDNPIYVQDKLYITDNVTLNAQIIVCNVGKLILGHKDINESFTITFNNANIFVDNGGQIEASTNYPITLDFQSSTTNGGIVFNGTGYGILKNVTFANINDAIYIDRSTSFPNLEDIEVRECHFTNNSITIVNATDVNIIDNDFTFDNTDYVTTAITSSGSANINIQGNEIVFTDYDNETSGISTVYNSYMNIVYNTIQDAWVGISVSNATDAFINNNQITRVNLNDPTVGISLDNAYNSEVKRNTISNYIDGFYLYYSSPIMYENEAINTLTIGSPKSMDAIYYSYPILAPTEVGGEMVWEAGLNVLKTTNSGSGIFIDDGCAVLENGYNTINGNDYYIDADILSPQTTWSIICNDWLDDPPNTNKFRITGVMEYFYDPWVPYCGGGGGGAMNEKVRSKNVKSLVFIDDPIEEPPQPIIVNHGFGVYDTIQVVNRSLNQTADRQLLSSASINTLRGNYSSAINTLQLLITNYQDSVTAISAMIKLLQCYDKMHADTSAFSSLRTYYLNLASNNQTDTSFARIASELAIKSLVRLNQEAQAITGYENIINNSTDSLEILCAELNIIETYMLLMGQGGDAPTFTGQLGYLKPNNLKDAMKMIYHKLFKFKNTSKQQILPTVYSLSQNYPNPFNAQTKINYSLPKASKVTIKIYDILGRLVKELVNDFKQAGYYTVTFEAINYASGIYFYRIEAGDFVQSKKMVLLK